MTLDEFLKLPGAKVHGGGPCPLSMYYGGEVLFRDGKVASLSHRLRQDLNPCWRHKDRHDDIIAYREVQP